MTEPITDERLAEIEARAAAATPGPWDYESDSADLIPSDPTTYRVFAPADGKVLFDTLNSQAGEIVTEYDEEGFAHAWDALGLANMKFAAHARTDVPDLVAALRAERARADAADARLERAEALLRRWVAWCDGPAKPHPIDDLDAARAFLAEKGMPREEGAP